MDMKRHWRHFNVFLVILALVSAGISPACAFISGKTSLIEICTADGAIKTVAVTEDGRQVSPLDHQDKTQKTDCAFCLNASAAKSALTGAVLVNAPQIPAPGPARTLAASLAQTPAKAFHATGPPASFLL
jgi:hypothetical protein